MSRFDPLIAQATARLAPDPELQLEVAHELRTHLEDSAAEFRAAGLSGEESAAKAAEAFGNADEVADKLLAANRKRMRVRRITRVAAGVTFGPLAAVVAIVVGWAAVTSLLSAFGLASRDQSVLGRPLSLFAEQTRFHTYQRAIENLPPPGRFLFMGTAQSPEPRHPFDTAKELAERWPDDPVYAANYAVHAVSHFHVGERKDGQPVWSPHDLTESLAVLDRGEKLDPDNGYYPLLRAAMLMDAGSQELYDPEDQSLEFQFTNGRGEKQTDHLVTVKVLDRDLFEKGMASLHEAAAKRCIRSYVAELASRRLAVLPPPKRLSNEVVRVIFSLNMALPYGPGLYDATYRAGAVAIDLASAGKRRQAQAILQDEASIARRVAAGAGFNEEILVAAQIHAVLLEQTFFVDRRLGLNSAAEAARKQYEADSREWHSLMVRVWGPLEKERTHAGLLEDAVSTHPSIVIDPQRSAAGRMVDYSVADQVAMAALAALLALAAAPLAPQWLARVRGRPVTTTIFVGWRRLAQVVLVGALLPLLLYGLYAYATSFNERSFGLVYTHSRLPVQYFALGAVMGGLLRLMTNRAAGRRAVELGVAMPPADRGWIVAQVIIAAALALVTIGYLVTWRPADPGADPDRLSARGLWELVLIFLLGSYALVSVLSAGSRPLFAQNGGPSSFIRKLSVRFPGWPGYAGFMAAATASLWLMWLALPAGARGSATLVLLSISLALAVILGMWILIRLFESGRANVATAGAPSRDPAAAWRATPITFAAAALAVVLISVPFLRHVERTSLENFDQRLRLWNDLEHSPFAQVQEQLAARSG